MLPDIHVPYHDPVALDAALKYGDSRNPDIVLLLGDSLDCYSVSNWEKDPRRRNFKKELEAGRELIAHLRERYPKARVIYKEGNHEERFIRYMTLRAPDLLGMDEFELPAMLGIPKEDYIGDMRRIRLGKLWALHGHEYKFSISNPVNPARGLFLRAKDHACCGHFHQTSEHAEGSLSGKVTACFSFGCLCDLHPDYMPLNKHNHGFGFVEIDKGGGFKVDNLRIINGEIF